MGTDKPSTGALCYSESLGEDECIKSGAATKEENEKKGDPVARNPASLNGVCSPVTCHATIESSSCESIPLKRTAFHIKTMEQLKDDLPARPINWVFWAIIAAVVLVVVIIIVCVICKPCSKAKTAGEALTEAKPAA